MDEKIIDAPVRSLSVRRRRIRGLMLRVQRSVVGPRASPRNLLKPDAGNLKPRFASRSALASRLRLRPQEIFVVAGKEVALAVGLQDVVEVGRLFGVQGSLQGFAAR